MAHDDHKNTIKGCLFKICFCRVPEQSVILFFVSRYCVALNRSGYSSVHPFRSSFVRICILLDYKSSPLPADAAADRVSYLHSLSVVYKTESCQYNVDLKHTSFDPSALFPHPAICINPLIYTNLCVSHSQVFFACPMSCLVLPLCIEPTPTISPYQPYAWVVYQHRPPRCSDRGGGVSEDRLAFFSLEALSNLHVSSAETHFMVLQFRPHWQNWIGLGETLPLAQIVSHTSLNHEVYDGRRICSTWHRSTCCDLVFASCFDKDVPSLAYISGIQQTLAILALLGGFCPWVGFRGV